MGALGFGLLAAVNPTMAILACVAVFAIAMLFPRGELIVAAFAASTFFERLSADYGLPITPTKALGIVAIALAFLPLVLRGTRVEWPTWQKHPLIMVFAFALAIWATASFAWATDNGQVKSNLIKLIMSIVMLFAIPLLVRRAKALRAVGWWIAGGGIGGALLGMAMGSNMEGRANGSFSDPNEFATATVAGAALALALGESSERLGVRWAGRIIACVSFIAVAASASRSGAAAVLLAFVVLLVTARGVERVRLTGILLIGVSAAAVWFMVAAGGQAAAERFGEEGSSGRTDLWRVAVYQFQDEPIHGVGLGNYPVRSAEYLRGDVHNWELFIRYPRTVHNTPLELLAELGIVGFLLFYAIIISCIAVLIGAIRRARRMEDVQLLGVCRGLLAALAAIMAASLTLSGLYTQLQWVLLGSCIAAACIARGRARELARQASVDESHEAELVAALTLDPLPQDDRSLIA